jgi:hypothetical protein
MPKDLGNSNSEVVLMKKMRVLLAVLLCGAALGFVALQLSSAASQVTVAPQGYGLPN